MAIFSGHRARRTPDNGTGDSGSGDGESGGGTVGVPPPGASKSDEELPALREALKKAEAKLKSGEIRGMSESTAHALMEEIRELNAQIREHKPTAVTSGSKWFPW